MGITCGIYQSDEHFIPFVRNSEERRELGRYRLRWADNIKINCIIYTVDWILLAQDRIQWWALVNTVKKLPISFGSAVG
jgi:hypothetical protein